MLENYLTNRKQLVEYNNVQLSTLKISTGVPQGSILGPILFIIYVNDVANASRLFNVTIYADDTTLSSTLITNNCKHGNPSDSLNVELSKVHTWMKANKLSLNISKTKFMIFHNINKTFTIPDLKIEDTSIEYVERFDFLGITLHKNLKWSHHTDKIGHKISKVIGILNRLKRYIPRDTLVTIYNTLISPHINYGILAWGHQCKSIIKLQKRAMRTITCSKYNAHTEPIFKQLGILKVDDLRHLSELKFYFKLANGTLPEYFDTYAIQRYTDLHDYSTRGRLNVIQPRIRCEISKDCIRYKLHHIINSNPNLLIDKVYTHSFNGFSNYAKKYFLSTYSNTCTILDCYICNNT
jgi:hypothetical protein